MVNQLTDTQPKAAHYYSRSTCAFCESTDLHQILDFGEVGLAGGFLTEKDIASEQKFPMRFCYCSSCNAVQVIDVIDPDILFSDYFYFSSAIDSLREHFANYANEVVSRFVVPKKSVVLEIGCNDGVLLKPIAEQNAAAKLIGVDPARNVVSTINHASIDVVNDFFTRESSRHIKEKFGAIDVVMANNVYAHIPDINGTTDGVAHVLADDGVFIFEVHDLDSVIGGLQYDMIYHEHLYYHSLLSVSAHLTRHGLVVFDVKRTPIHAGSKRFYATKKGSKYARNPSPRVEAELNREISLGYNSLDAFKGFAKHVSQKRDELMKVLNELRRRKRKVIGYGASGRANTIMQYCRITKDHLDCIIDDAPAKHGFLTPVNHIPIASRNSLDTEKPDYILVLAWSYANDIASKCKRHIDKDVRLVIPLPDVRLLLNPISNVDIL